MQEQAIFAEIEKKRSQMTQTLMQLIRIPAMGPENGGEGEIRKAEELAEILATLGFERIERYDSEDERVPSKKRPNMVAYLDGEADKEKLWIITHLDIVPPGEGALWKVTKPFEPTIREERVYGRGSEDNMQSMVASIFAAKTLKDLNIKPRRTVALAFVADEEHGSKHGIQHLIRLGLFHKEDLIIVPDSGNEDGSFIEIAEKSSIWVKIRTIGKQAHASRPHTGLNANRIGMQFALALDKLLHEKYSQKDPYFDPPESTIEPTKKDRNVDAVNIIPGEDITYFDCRILPTYNLDGVITNVNNLAREYENKTHATIEITITSKNLAPKPTDANAKIVTTLEGAIKTVRHVQPKIGGIGGGTCAAYFRKADLPAVVWSTIDETAHQPDEYARIDNIVNDAKVYALMMTM